MARRHVRLAQAMNDTTVAALCGVESSPTTTDSTNNNDRGRERIRRHDDTGGSRDERAKHSLSFILHFPSIDSTESREAMEVDAVEVDTRVVSAGTRPRQTRLRSSAATRRTEPPSKAETRKSNITRIGSETKDAKATQVSQPRRQGGSKGKAATSGTDKPPATAVLTYEQKRLARQCTVDDCKNYTINNGRCFRHGGGKQCTFENCRASAKIAGLCWKHGGSIPCVVDGCERRGKSRGRCWAHGGGTKCQADACAKVAVSNGFCWAHGGGKRCQFDGCQRPAYERTLNYCPTHFKRFESGEEVLEL